MATINLCEGPPSTLEEFIAIRDAEAVSPEGGAACFVLALNSFTEDPDLGKLCLAAVTDRTRLETTEGGYFGRKLMNHDLRLISMQLGDSPWIPASYVCGTSPAGRYIIDPGSDVVVEVNADPRKGPSSCADPAKVFVSCSGADSPRPVTLKVSTRGFWKAVEWSSLLVGVRPPALAEEDIH